MGIKKINVFMIDGLVDKLQGIDQKIVTLEGGAVDLSTADLTTNQDFADLASRITVLEGQTIDISTVDLTTNQAFSDLQTSVTNLETVTTNMGDSINTINSQITALEEGSIDLSAADLMLNPQFTDLKQNGSTLARHNATLIEQLQTDTTTLQNDLTDLDISIQQDLIEMHNQIIQINTDLTQLANTGDLSLNAFSKLNIDSNLSSGYHVDSVNGLITVNKLGGDADKTTIFDSISDWNQFNLTNLDASTNPGKLGLKATGIANVAPMERTIEGDYYDFSDLVDPTTEWKANLLESWTLANGDVFSLVSYENLTTTGVTELYVFEKIKATGELKRSKFFASQSYTKFTNAIDGRALRKLTNTSLDHSYQFFKTYKNKGDTYSTESVDSQYELNIGANKNDNPMYIFDEKSGVKGGRFDDGNIWFIASFRAWGINDVLNSYPRAQYYDGTNTWYYYYKNAPFRDILIAFRSIELNGKIHFVWDILGPTFQDSDYGWFNYIYDSNNKRVDAEYKKEQSWGLNILSSSKALRVLNTGKNLAFFIGKRYLGDIQESTTYVAVDGSYRYPLSQPADLQYQVTMPTDGLYFKDNILGTPTIVYQSSTGEYDIKFTTSKFFNSFAASGSYSKSYYNGITYMTLDLYHNFGSWELVDVERDESANVYEPSNKVLVDAIVDTEGNYHILYDGYKGVANSTDLAALTYKRYRPNAEGIKEWSLPNIIAKTPTYVYSGDPYDVGYRNSILGYNPKTKHAVVLVKVKYNDPYTQYNSYTGKYDLIDSYKYSFKTAYIIEMSDLVNFTQKLFETDPRLWAWMESDEYNSLYPGDTGLIIDKNGVIHSIKSSVDKYKFFTTDDITAEPVSSDIYAILPNDPDGVGSFKFLHPMDTIIHTVTASDNVYEMDTSAFSTMALMTYATSGSATFIIDAKSKAKWMSYQLAGYFPKETAYTLNLSVSNDKVSWQSIANNSDIELTIDGEYPEGRYLKILFNLTSETEFKTPLIDKMLIKYKVYEVGGSEGEVITLPISISKNPISILTDTLSSVPDTISTLDLYISLDDGVTWMTIPKNDATEIKDLVSTGKLRFKALLKENATLSYMKYLLETESPAVQDLYTRIALIESSNSLSESNNELLVSLQADYTNFKDSSILVHDELSKQVGNNTVNIDELRQNVNEFAINGKTSLSAFDLANIDRDRSTAFIINDSTGNYMASKQDIKEIVDNSFSTRSDFAKFTIDTGLSVDTMDNKVSLKPVGFADKSPLTEFDEFTRYYDFSDIIPFTNSTSGITVRGLWEDEHKYYSIVYLDNTDYPQYKGTYYFERDKITGLITRENFYIDPIHEQFNDNIMSGRVLRTNKKSASNRVKIYKMYHADMGSDYLVEEVEVELVNGDRYSKGEGNYYIGNVDAITMDNGDIALLAHMYTTEEFTNETTKYKDSSDSTIANYQYYKRTPDSLLAILVPIFLNGKRYFVWDILAPNNYYDYTFTLNPVDKAITKVYPSGNNIKLVTFGENFGTQNINKDLNVYPLKNTWYLAEGTDENGVPYNFGGAPVLLFDNMIKTHPIVTYDASTGNYTVTFETHHVVTELTGSSQDPESDAYEWVTTDDANLKKSFLEITAPYTKISLEINDPLDISEPATGLRNIQVVFDPDNNIHFFYGAASGYSRRIKYRSYRKNPSTNLYEVTPLVVVDEKTGVSDVEWITDTSGYKNFFTMGAAGYNPRTKVAFISYFWENGVRSNDYRNFTIAYIKEKADGSGFDVTKQDATALFVHDKTYSINDELWFKTQVHDNNGRIHLFYTKEKYSRRWSMLHEVVDIDDITIPPSISPSYRILPDENLAETALDPLYLDYSSDPPDVPQSGDYRDWSLVNKRIYQMNRNTDVFYVRLHPRSTYTPTSGLGLMLKGSLQIMDPRVVNLYPVTTSTTTNNKMTYVIDSGDLFTKWIFAEFVANVRMSTNVNVKLYKSNDSVVWEAMDDVYANTVGAKAYRLNMYDSVYSDYHQTRFVKIEITLNSSDPYVTPTLDKLLLKYQQIKPSTGVAEIVTLPITTSVRPITIVTDSLYIEPNTSSTVEFLMSLDDGKSWLILDPSSSQQIPSGLASTGKMRFKAVIKEDASMKYMRYLLEVEDVIINELKQDIADVDGRLTSEVTTINGQISTISTDLANHRGTTISKIFVANFQGINGELITHNFGHQNFSVSMIPQFIADGNNDIGDIGFDISDNELIVFNTGTSRNPFRLILTGYDESLAISSSLIAAPTNITHTVDGTAKPTITWDATSNVIKGYNVYRDGVLQTTTPITTNSYLDSTAESNITYEYGISSVDYYGNESEIITYSLMITIVVDSPTP